MIGGEAVGLALRSEQAVIRSMGMERGWTALLSHGVGRGDTHKHARSHARTSTTRNFNGRGGETSNRFSDQQTIAWGRMPKAPDEMLCDGSVIVVEFINYDAHSTLLHKSEI